MAKRNKYKSSEEIFLDHITSLIQKLLIDNKNYRNGHCTSMSSWDAIDYIKRNATYILNEIENTKHLILPESTL